jgi:hypothetical protein
VSTLLAAQGPAIGLPDEVIPALRAQAKRAAFSSLRIASVTAEVSALLADAEIAALFIKGVALSQQTTGTIAARSTGDVDVLVTPEDMPRVHAALLDSGFRNHMTVYPSDTAAWRYTRWVTRELLYKRQSDFVDLHWRVAVAPGLLPEAVTLLGRASTVTIANREVPTLSVSDACAATCLHAYHDGYSQLRYLVDLARLLRLGPHAQSDWPPQLRRLMVDTLAFAEQLLPGWPADARQELGLDRVAPSTAYAWRLWGANAGLGGLERYTVRPSDYVRQYRSLLRYAPRRTKANAQFLAKMAINTPDLEPGTGAVGFVRASAARFRQTPHRVSQSLRDQDDLRVRP